MKYVWNGFKPEGIYRVGMKLDFLRKKLDFLEI
jgi:hypothetical protein